MLLFKSNADCKPLVFDIVKSPSDVLFCCVRRSDWFARTPPCNKFSCACNPLVVAIVKPPSDILSCLLFNAVCNPLVVAIVKSPYFEIFCFATHTLSDCVLV